MRTIALFEDEGYADLLPLLYWRTVFELRLGRKIVLDRAAQCLGLPVSGVWTRDWMAPVASVRCGAPVNQPIDGNTVLVNGRWVFDRTASRPDHPCVGMIDGQVAYVVCDAKVAAKLSAEVMLDAEKRQRALSGLPTETADGTMIRYPWDVLAGLRDALCSDWNEVDAIIETELDPGIAIDDPLHLHVGERSSIHPTAVLQTTGGPVFISHDVTIGAYAVIEGPVYIGPGTRIHPHAWLHGANAIGPVCKLGGEIDGSIIDGYANKQHTGFFGHAYVGTWVNIGAGATNSDLKNTYGSVRSTVRGAAVDTGQTFFGCVIGDHTKIGINAAIPTGAVLGFAANVASARVCPKIVPSFGWVTDTEIENGDPARLLDIATKVMARRSIDMADEEIELFLSLEEQTRQHERSQLA